jgi:hypothetical protein
MARYRANPCPECGTSLDEVPFDPCRTHRAHARAEPPISQDEIDCYLAGELARLLHERTGDD